MQAEIDRLVGESEVTCRESFNNRFTYHKATPHTSDAYIRIRKMAKAFAYEILGTCPASREQAIALERVEEAMFWANASIARNSGE